jgi:hypothetical protein
VKVQLWKGYDMEEERIEKIRNIEIQIQEVVKITTSVSLYTYAFVFVIIIIVVQAFKEASSVKEGFVTLIKLPYIFIKSIGALFLALGFLILPIVILNLVFDNDSPNIIEQPDFNYSQDYNQNNSPSDHSNPNGIDFVKPHWRTLPDGSKIWVDGDGVTSVNRSVEEGGGWWRRNP